MAPHPRDLGATVNNSYAIRMVLTRFLGYLTKPTVNLTLVERNALVSEDQGHDSGTKREEFIFLACSDPMAKCTLSRCTYLRCGRRATQTSHYEKFQLNTFHTWTNIG